jgi:nucleoside-diphosphate-sugar epimerase
MARDGERVLITGGSGFIGAFLVRDLIASGQEVHLLLRRDSKHLWRLAGLDGKYTAHWADLRDVHSLQKAVKACRPEWVYHMASCGAYPNQQDRTSILATNILGTANLLDALEGHDYRAFVYTGSSSEYGHKNSPMKEDDRLEPRTDYAVSKAAATLLCQAEAHKGRPVSTVRVFSAYGPWEEPSRLVPYVMACCHRGVRPKITVGRQPRDFIYVADVITLLKIAAEQPRVRGQVLHAGSGGQHSVREMVEIILAVCGSRLTADFGAEPMRPDEPSHWLADIERTTALTGWKPVFDLRAGIEETWRWYCSTHAQRAA